VILNGGAMPIVQRQEAAMTTERKKRNSYVSLRPRLVKIVRATSGGPIRTILERGHRKPTGVFTSRKNRRAFAWEAIDERHFMWISEVDYRVTTFLVQPFRMEFHFADGGRMDYFPDIERRLGPKVEIIEIKKTAAEIAKDPRYANKIALARAVCRKKGWTFRIVSADTDILPTMALSNARLIRLDRFTSIDAQDHIRLGDAMRLGRGRTTYAKAIAALSRCDDPWDRDGTARLHAMIVRGHVCVDITRAIRPESVVFSSDQIFRRPLRAA
jgi:hypothetical protein